MTDDTLAGFNEKSDEAKGGVKISNENLNRINKVYGLDGIEPGFSDVGQVNDIKNEIASLEKKEPDPELDEFLKSKKAELNERKTRLNN